MSVRCKADTVEPAATEAQPSALTLPSPSLSEVPHLPVWCSNTHDHLDGGLACYRQNVMSTTAAGMHAYAWQTSQSTKQHRQRGRGDILVKLDVTTQADSSREPPTYLLEQLLQHGQACHRYCAKHKNIQLVHIQSD